MNDAIIVINAGSSSLKFSLYGVSDHEPAALARGQIEGLNTSPRLKIKNAGGHILVDGRVEHSAQGFGHPEAFAHFSNWLNDHFAAGYSPVGVGHRIVHGGSKFTSPTLIDDDVVAEIEKLIPFMPLHLPSNLAAVKAVMQSRPDLPQVACFDTSFHQGRAKVTQRFGLPESFYKAGLQRWGFHGLSYEYISGRLKKLSPAAAKGRVIVAHLGNGASLCAMQNGRSVDTTMSFSVLDGLPMGTRCGKLDPGAILYLMHTGMSLPAIEDLLYKKSGLLGISGVSSDVRDLLASDAPLAAEAIEYFVYRIACEIGSLTTALGGLDGLVFTAGIGENSPEIRQRICDRLSWLGIALDPLANQRSAAWISQPGQNPSVWVIPTDEEAVIAAHTLKMIRAAATA